MLNTYLLRGNEILIEAPGNSNRNKIKNDLIWDINALLSEQFELYYFLHAGNHLHHRFFGVFQDFEKNI